MPPARTPAPVQVLHQQLPSKPTSWCHATSGVLAAVPLSSRWPLERASVQLLRGGVDSATPGCEHHILQCGHLHMLHGGVHAPHRGVVALQASLDHAGNGAQVIANRRERLLDCNEVWILVLCCSDGCGHSRFKLDILRGWSLKRSCCGNSHRSSAASCG